jgi:hypothetical protein
MWRRIATSWLTSSIIFCISFPNMIYGFRHFWNLSVNAQIFIFLFVNLWTLFWTEFYWLISSPKCISINSHFYRWRGQPVNPAPVTSILQVQQALLRNLCELCFKSTSSTTKPDGGDAGIWRRWAGKTVWMPNAALPVHLSIFNCKSAKIQSQEAEWL